MESFFEKHAGSVQGVLSGFDRILFRGLLFPLVYPQGFDGFVRGHGVRYADFKLFVRRVSDHLIDHAKGIAKAQGRPYLYIPSPKRSKEDLARSIMERDQITEGLIVTSLFKPPAKKAQKAQIASPSRTSRRVKP